jgi:ATP-binding cassette, subfamily C, bacterial CydC
VSAAGPASGRARLTWTPGWAPWSQAVGFAAPWRRDLRAGLVAGATQQILVATGAAAATYAVARVVRGASYDQVSLWILLVVLVALPLVRLSWAGAAARRSVANRVKVDQAQRIFAAADGLDAAQLDQRRSGEIAAIASHDLEVVSDFLADHLGELVSLGVLSLSATVGITALDWRLGLTALIWLGSVATLASLASRTRPERPEVSHRDHRGQPPIRGELVDDLQGLREIVAQGRVEAVVAELEREDRGAGVLPSDGPRAGIETWLGPLTPLVVLAVGTVRVTGGLSPTRVAPAVVLALLAGWACTRLGAIERTLTHLAVASARITALTEGPARSWPECGPVPATSEVAFEGVAFQYRAGDPMAVTGLSFRIDPGETVALVGHSGAGKSTTANLLLRFLSPTQGKITIGGHDVVTLDESTLRELIAYVPQDGYLFNTTARENLRLGRPDATDAEVEAAARGAAAWEFLTALPDGLDTPIGERGGQLSGGQRQRLAMARALLADRPILVLDEPVSHLDAENEQLALTAMTRLRTGRTTLIVAHRRSTTRHADRVLVLDHGRLTASGTHDQLRSTDPTYAGLFDDGGDVRPGLDGERRAWSAADR